MHVLIADPVASEAQLGLEALGLKVTVDPSLSANTLAQAAADVEILVVTDTPVNRRTIEAASKLALIIHAGSGAEGVDVQAASERAIFVADCPGFDASARAEHALGLMLSADRDLRAATDHQGPAATGLYGRRLGLLGFGPVARRLAEIASPLELHITVATDELTRSLATEFGVSLASDKAELFRRSDIISVHSDPHGHATVGAAELAAMNPGGLLLAVEGPAGLDLAAVVDAVKSGRLYCALDAPSSGLSGPVDKALSTLAGLPGARVTRDQGAATQEAWRRAATAVVSTVHRFLQEGIVDGCINVARNTPAQGTLLIRHRHATPALVAVFDVLAEAGIKVLEVQNLLFEGAASACLHIRLDALPSPATLARIERHQDVIHADLASDEG